MKTGSTFRRLETIGPPVTVEFNGRSLELPLGDNLAAALLTAGIVQFRETPVSGAPRAPFCMMGSCFECLLEIDGVTTQACLVSVSEGLVIHSARIVEETSDG